MPQGVGAFAQQHVPGAASAMNTFNQAQHKVNQVSGQFNQATSGVWGGGGGHGGRRDYDEGPQGAGFQEPQSGYMPRESTLSFLFDLAHRGGVALSTQGLDVSGPGADLASPPRPLQRWAPLLRPCTAARRTTTRLTNRTPRAVTPARPRRSLSTRTGTTRPRSAAAAEARRTATTAGTAEAEEAHSASAVRRRASSSTTEAGTTKARRRLSSAVTSVARPALAEEGQARREVTVVGTAASPSSAAGSLASEGVSPGLAVEDLPRLLRATCTDRAARHTTRAGITVGRTMVDRVATTRATRAAVEEAGTTE